MSKRTKVIVGAAVVVGIVVVLVVVLSQPTAASPHVGVNGASPAASTGSVADLVQNKVATATGGIRAAFTPNSGKRPAGAAVK